MFRIVGEAKSLSFVFYRMVTECSEWTVHLLCGWRWWYFYMWSHHLGAGNFPRGPPPHPRGYCSQPLLEKRSDAVCAIFQAYCAIFFASVRARTFSLNCAVKIGININTLYISWRGGQTSLFNGISCCFDENFKIMLLCYFFWNFLSLLFYTLFFQLCSQPPPQTSFCLQQVLTEWIWPMDG